MQDTQERQPLSEKLLPLVLTAIVIIADQISKALVVRYIPRLSPFSDEGVISVIGDYVRLIHVRNKAVAFSLGSGLSAPVRLRLFAIMPLVIIIFMLIFYFRSNVFTRLQRWAVCGIIGGGLGNLIDRFFRPEGVVDFVDCYFFNIFGMERWPTFNVADMSVVICALLFALSFFLQAKDSSKGDKQ